MFRKKYMNLDFSIYFFFLILKKFKNKISIFIFILIILFPEKNKKFIYFFGEKNKK